MARTNQSAKGAPTPEQMEEIQRVAAEVRAEVSEMSRAEKSTLKTVPFKLKELRGTGIGRA